MNFAIYHKSVSIELALFVVYMNISLFIIFRQLPNMQEVET